MKVGQLLSMDSGQVLPPELSDILARLRESAHHMPSAQVERVLLRAWGADWQQQFRHFDFKPIAAASIGQVHGASLPDGRRLAVKIQYPGIRHSIDSDIDNVIALLRLSKLIPEDMNFLPVLNDAKRQLHAEADYNKEAQALEQYSRLVKQDQRFELPEVVRLLTTGEVLAMTYMNGLPIENLVNQPPSERNAAAAAILELALREVFVWGYVQTDPNFANYRYQPASGRIQLLDFGATREYSGQQVAALRQLLHACIDGDDNDIETAAAKVGYVDEHDPSGYRSGIVALLRDASAPVRNAGSYDFGSCDLDGRMRDRLVQMRLHDNFWRMPPTGVLFLHRKLGGMYMLLKRLRASIDVAQLVARLAI